SGVGAAVCLALAQTGSNVAVGYHSNARAAHDLCEKIAYFGSCAVPIPVNVARADEVYRFMQEVDETLGPIDILVNCAGTWHQATFQEMEDREWDEALAVNLNGSYYACKAAARVMIRRRSGKMVNFSSVAAVRGARSGHAHYATAKGGVASLTR